MKRTILLLLAAMLSAGILLNSYRTAQREAYLLEYQKAVQELEYQRKKVEEELVALERQQNAGRDCAMGILLFEHPSQRLYTEVLPVMQEFGLTGAVAITPEACPGQPECITAEQMEELREAGWIFCAGWDGSTEPEKLPELFEQLKLPRTKSVCIRSGAFLPGQSEELLKKAGYADLFHHGETGSILSHQEQANGMRQIGTIMWNDPAILIWLDEAVERRSLLAIGVDFETDCGDFEETLFRNMCRTLKEHEDRFLLVNLTDPTEVEQRAEAYSIARRDFLMAEMERYEKQIQQIYELYTRYGAKPENHS